SGDPNGEIFVRVGLSRVERRLGAFGPAREQAEEAVRLVEDMRAGLQGPLSRGSFLATRYDAYEELVALLMERGHAREALEVAERARARNLSEDLAEGSLSRAAGEGRGGGSDRKRTLQAELQAMDARRQSLAAGDPRDPRLRDLDAELRRKGIELDRLATVRAGLSGFRPLTAAGIQGLADEESVFLIYLLSEPASFAWTVDGAGVEPHLLPNGKRIDTLARRVVAAWSQKSQAATRDTAARAARELSQAILAPLRHRLKGRRRLVILADGALHLVPFAALPVPEASEPLLLDHEIVLLPSATFLDQQRRRLAGREPAPGEIAVLADPVFSPEDERLSRDGSQTARSSGGRGFDPGPLQRLPFTALEAEAILRLAPRKETFLAVGTDAHRDLVTSGALRRFRLLHFATHGLLHPVLPERSGIVLSQVDVQGRRREGFLSAPDVAGLDLPAEMVVLSACRTGLGREVRGEGLVGLTQAFFRAGARRVVVSHWSVQDRATAELMARFYRGLLGEGLSSAAALRAAQLSIRSEEKWSSPWFWAGFSLHGDWQ
ncbi:MAG TPA: CHAT domain-containing protein, partial [Thermoanaerobaculia bacterium]|nr:CHAT domain-containing protein [Thermoanaerobaculia bacterium]